MAFFLRQVFLESHPELLMCSCRDWASHHGTQNDHVVNHELGGCWAIKLYGWAHTEALSAWSLIIYDRVWIDLEDTSKFHKQNTVLRAFTFALSLFLYTFICILLRIRRLYSTNSSKQQLQWLMITKINTTK